MRNPCRTIFSYQVECKKAQPKEVVQAANTAALLGKRVILSNLGILPGLAVPGLGGTQAAQQPAAVQQQQQQQLTAGHSALQAALQQQLAASAALGMTPTLFLFPIFCDLMPLCWHFISIPESLQNFNSQLFLFAHQSHACLSFNLVPLSLRELRQAAGHGAALHLQPPLLALLSALRGRGAARGSAHRAGGSCGSSSRGSWGSRGRGAVHSGQPPHVPAVRRPGPGHRPSNIISIATTPTTSRGCGGCGPRGSGGSRYYNSSLTYNTSLLSPGPSLGAPLAAGVSPYPAYNLASVGGVDWSALGYSLPGPAMYATL